LSSSDAFSDGLDLGGEETAPPSADTACASASGLEPVHGAAITDPEMAAFWSSLDAFLASSSSSATVVAGATGATDGAGDELAKLWDEEVEASSLVELLAQVDNSNYVGLRAEDILQQDIFA